MGTLTEAIKAYQRKQGLSDGKLAELLGIHRTTWLFIKSGRTVRPSYRFVRLVGEKIPALRRQQRAYIAETFGLTAHGSSSSSASTVPPKPGTGVNRT